MRGRVAAGLAVMGLVLGSAGTAFAGTAGADDWCPGDRKIEVRPFQ